MNLPEEQGILLHSSSHCKHTEYLIQLLYGVVFTPQGVTEMEIHHSRFMA